MNSKIIPVVICSAIAALLFLVQFISKGSADLWILLAIVLALYVTSLWEFYYFLVIGFMTFWILVFIILGQINAADKGAIFLVIYFFLFIVMKYRHLDLNDSLLIKLVRPVMLYKNWVDIYLLIIKRYFPKEITYVMRNGLQFMSRAASKDFIILDETWGANLYMKYGITIRSGDTVVDIGAYIGDFTVYASQAVGKGKVFAYEPFKLTYEYLCKNIKINNCHNVMTINSAVGGKNGKTRLYIPKDAEFGSSLLDITEYGECEEVTINMCTLDSIFSKNHIDSIDLLKMDCEGGEYEILLSSEKYLKRIGAITLEYHQMKGRP